MWVLWSVCHDTAGKEKKQNQATHIPQHDDKTEIASAAREKAHSIPFPLSSSDKKNKNSFLVLLLLRGEKRRQEEVD